MYGRLAIVSLAVLSLQTACSTVNLFPSGTVVITLEREDFIFTCLTSQPAVYRNVTWLLNGSTPENLNLGLDAIIMFDPVGSSIGTLTFTRMHLKYNETTIQCRGLLESGSLTPPSVETLLLLQGTLAPVGYLNFSFLNSTLFLTWTAPFTLDIYGTTVDITYIVQVTNLTTSLVFHIEGERSMSFIEFLYPLPHESGCDNHEFTVTPINEAGHGISNTVQLSQAMRSPRLVEILLTASSERGGARNSDVVFHQLTMSSPVCNAEINLTDKNTGNVITLGSLDLNISSTLMGADVVFTNERLALNRQYRFMVNASNINGSAISTGDISTYDVVSSGVHVNPLRIHTEYLPNSNATGVFYGFFYFEESGIDFRRSVYFALGRNDSLSYELPSPLAAGVYYVHTYVIGLDGLLNRGKIFPATTEVFLEMGDESQTSISPFSSSEIDDCDTSTYGMAIVVSCSFSPTSSSTGFLLVVHKKGVNSARRLLVNTTEQGEPQGPVTVQMPEGGAYHVTVFPIRVRTGIVDSNVAYAMDIAVTTGTSTPMAPMVSSPLSTTPSSFDMLPIITGIGFGVLALLAVILGAVILVVVCHRSKGSMRLSVPPEKAVERTETEVHMELSDTEAEIGLAPVYEEVGDAKSSFTYTQNILYGISTDGVKNRLTSDLIPEVPTSISHDSSSLQRDNKSSHKVTEESHNLNDMCDPDQEENSCASGAAAKKSRDLNPRVSAEYCDLEGCPAYGVTQLNI